jgi:hypothetical protein
LLIVFTALSISCAHQQVVETIDRSSLVVVEKSYVIPFTLGETNVPVIAASVNINPDKPEVHPPEKRLCIDTGAAHTSFYVPPSVISDLPVIMHDAALEDRQLANGTIIQVCHIKEGRVTIGNLSVDLPVDACGHEMAADEGNDGVIGMDFLSRFDVRFDFQARTMTLTER